MGSALGNQIAKSCNTLGKKKVNTAAPTTVDTVVDENLFLDVDDWNFDANDIDIEFSVTRPNMINNDINNKNNNNNNKNNNSNMKLLLGREHSFIPNGIFNNCNINNVQLHFHN